MGANNSKHSEYPFPTPQAPNGYEKPPSQSVWSFVGKGKKAKRQSESLNHYVPGGYSYVPQPYPMPSQQNQNYSSNYYPAAGPMQQASYQVQPNMQMPVPNAHISPPTGQSYDPVVPPPPIISMPQPPQTTSGVPPPPQMQYEAFNQQSQQQQAGIPPPPQMQYESFNQQQQQAGIPPPPQMQYESFNQQQQQQPAGIPPPPQMQYETAQQQTQEQYEARMQDQQDQQGRRPQPPRLIPPNPNGYPEGPTSASVYGPPGPRPRSPLRNPLPTPPRDLYEMSPYRSLLKDLPATTQMLERHYSANGQGSNSRPQYGMQQSQRQGGGGLGALLGSKKKGGKGLFRSSSNASGQREPPVVLLGTMAGGMYAGPPQRSNSQNSYLGAPSSGSSHHGAGLLGAGMPTPHPIEPDPNRGPPVRFDHTSPLSGFMNHSPHRVLYKNHTYPTALHLLEALKFLGHREDLADRIRAVRDAQDVYPLSASMHEFVRGDWGQVFLQMVEEVLYMKFKQHPSLRNQLMNTGTADVIYSEPDDAYWGEGSLGQGTNELGKSIMRVRERLHKEGFTVGGGQP